MARRFRFVALLALLVVSVAGLVACGGDDGGSDASANDLLKATFGPDQNVKSGNLAIALSLDAKGLKNINGPIALKLDGPFQTVGKGKLPKLDLSLSLSGSGTNFSAGAISTGDKGYIKLQGTTYVVDDPTFAQFRKGYEDSASKSSGKSEAPSFKSLGIDPLGWLTDPKVAGSEDVGGAETEHITAGVDVAKFLDDVSTLLGKAGQLGQAAAGVPSSLSDQQRKDIESAVKSASLDVWTGKDDKALRRLKLTIGIDVPEAVRSRAGGLSTGTLTFDLTIADLNEPQTISAPENARPIAELEQLVAGGATGATPDATTTTTPAAPATGQASSQYLDCIAAAGSDVAKIQQCATLAGQ
ncbi:MAG: hypothetical protein ACJ762_04275 [Solirubrobacteraceae bacterium]